MPWSARILALLILAVMLVSGCGSGGSGGGGPSPAQVAASIAPGTVERIEFSLISGRLPQGFAQQFEVISVSPGGSRQDITAAAEFFISDPAVATMLSPGLVAGLKSGSIRIVASYGGKNGTLELTVTDARLQQVQISPAGLKLPIGVSQQYAATGLFDDQSTLDLSRQCAWSTNSTAVATISANGLLHTLSSGLVTVSATCQNVSGTARVQVGIAQLTAIRVEPGLLSLPQGLTQKLTATGLFNDGTSVDLTTQVQWSSDNTAVGVISNEDPSKGLLTAVSQGKAVISANLGNLSGNSTVNVTPARLLELQLTPTNLTLPRGLQHQFVATGLYSDNSTIDLTTQATWSCDSQLIASISNANGTQGIVSANQVGNCVISASSGNTTARAALLVSPAQLKQIQITPANSSLPRGLTHPFLATGIYTDNTNLDLTDRVMWVSDNPEVATISIANGSKGLVTANNVGTSKIAANLGSISAKADLEVTPAQLTQIQITPGRATLPRGLEQHLTATGIYSDSTNVDLTTQVNWSSNKPEIARISNVKGSEGLATAANVGTADLIALSGNVTSKISLEVTEARLTQLQVTPNNPSLPRGLTQQMTATGIFSDNTNLDLTGQVTWTSTSPEIGTISNANGARGLAVAGNVGSTTIQAISGNLTASTEMTVTTAQLARLLITPSNASLPSGLSMQYGAVGFFTDQSSIDLTEQVTWNSSAQNVAPISNAAGSRGKILAQVVGSTNITADYASLRGETPLTVTPAELVQLQIKSAPSNLPRGLTQQYSVVGIFTDQSSAELTKQATWTSSQGSTASVSNSEGTQGVATALNLGATVISAQLGAVSASVDLNVTQAVLTELKITPANATLVGFHQTLQFDASGLFSDSTSLNLTNQVTWTSSVGNVALISNASGSRGLAYSNNATGETAIGASYGSLSSATRLQTTSNPAGTDWTYRRGAPQLSSVVYGKGRYVATGPLGTIMMSFDGKTWFPQASHTAQNLGKVIFDGHRFIAAGSDGTTSVPILISDDGEVWTPQTTPAHQGLNSIAFDGNRYVAVGTLGIIMTSTDAQTWSVQVPGNGNSLYHVTAGPGQFVATGESGAILTSPDGLVWTSQTSGISGLGNGIVSVVYGNGLYVAVGSNGRIFTSPNGADWTIEKFNPSPSCALISICYDGQQFVAVGQDPGQDAPIITSVDGRNWTSHNIVAPPYKFYTLTGVTSGAGQLVTVGWTDIFTSPDGASWTAQKSIPAPDLKAVTWGQGLWCAVGSEGWVLTSPDTLTWSAHTTPTTHPLYTVIYGNGLFVAGGEGDYYYAPPSLLTSQDGINWTQQSLNSIGALTGGVYAAGMYVMVGSGGIFTSPDGVNWTRRTAPGAFTVCYGNGTFVAYPGPWTSPDGIVWTQRSSATPNFLTAIAYGNNMFVQVGLNGTIISSPDGVTWTPRHSGTRLDFQSVTFGNGKFVASTDYAFLYGETLESTDGVNWGPSTNKYTFPFSGLTFANNMFVGVGWAGSIFTSP